MSLLVSSPSFVPFFMSSPHSGEKIPKNLAPWLDLASTSKLLCDVDRYVDLLYGPVCKSLNIPFICAPYHRYVLDLNRFPEDTDQSTLVSSPFPPGSFPKGLYWAMTTQGESLITQPLSQKKHEKLLKKVYFPFHTKLDKQYKMFFSQNKKKVFQIDAHSMPSKGTSLHRDPGKQRPEIVVSDCHGQSCQSTYKDLVIKSYRQEGFETQYNWPYVGGRITEKYGKPHQGRHCIQVELNRSLYMNEETKALLPKEHYLPLQKRLSKAIQSIYQGIAKEETKKGFVA